MDQSAPKATVIVFFRLKAEATAASLQQHRRYGIIDVASAFRRKARAVRSLTRTGGRAMIVTYRGTVYPSQCDHMGHMNVMWYVAKFDEASWQLLSALGLTGSRFRRAGIGVAAVDQHIQYKRELHAGDVVTIRSSVLGVTEKSIRLVHEMTNDETGEIAAVTILVGVHLDMTSRRARAIPSDVRECATRMIAEFEAIAHADDTILTPEPL
jgi:acyl-CoA thioester hydrolase